MVGAGVTSDRLDERATALGVRDLFHHHGEVAPADVGPIVNAADAFCLPSFDEGLPVAMMEAMAVGRPVRC